MNDAIPTNMLARMLSEKERAVMQAIVLMDCWQIAPRIENARTGRVLSNLSSRYGLFEIQQGKTAGRRLFRPRKQAFDLQSHLLTKGKTY